MIKKLHKKKGMPASLKRKIDEANKEVAIILKRVTNSPARRKAISRINTEVGRAIISYGEKLARKKKRKRKR